MERRIVSWKLGGALALGLLLFGMVANPRVLIASKYFLDNYAGGFSAAKSLVLVAFLFSLMLLSPLPSPWKKSWNWTLPVGLAILYLISAAEQLYYVLQTGLDFSQRSVLVFDGMQSSTRPEHVHSSKAIAAIVLKYTGQTFDAGFPFLSVYSEPWLWFHAGFYLLVATLGFLLVHHYDKELSPERSLFLALAVYLLIKGGIDGGLLSLPELVRLGVLSWAIWKGPKRAVGLSLAVILLAASFLIDGSDNYLYNSIRVPVAILATTLPLFFERARLQKSWPWAVAGFAALLVLLATPVFYFNRYSVQQRPPFSLATWRYGSEALKKDWTISMVSAKTIGDSDLGKVTGVRQGDRLTVYRFQLHRDTTPFELCQTYGLNVLRTPIIWYQGPGYVVIEGPFEMPDPNTWLTSNTVTAYSMESRDGFTKLVLELFPGAQTNVAVDVLPKGPFVTNRVDLTYRKPQMATPWLPGPGAVVTK